MTICLIYSTHPSLEQARETAKQLLEEQLVACCNILPAGESHYVWEGKPVQASEIYMLSKTPQLQAQRVMERIRSLHPYTSPAVLELPVTGGNPAFLDWVEKMVKTTR